MNSAALFAVTPVAILLTVAIATWLVGARRRGRFLREAGIILLAYFAYFMVRGITQGNFIEARHHARLLVNFEQSMGIFVDPSAQAFFVSKSFIVKFANWMYVWGHWPVIGAVTIWLFARRPASYAMYRNALLISGAIGLVLYVTFPAAPPRLIGLGFRDTVFSQSNFAEILQPTSLTNQYAAFPSMHFGWSLLMGIAIARESRSRIVRLLAPLLPIAMLASVVLTANHYIVDTMAGGAIALLGLEIALVLHRVDRRALGWSSWGDTLAAIPPLSESAIAMPGVAPHHLRQSQIELQERLARYAVRPVLPPT